ncbi:MAG: hypothetical protein ACRDOD_14665 [Streptosporangiaceae bacterium]
MSEPDRVHLLDAYRDLLDECHRHRVYLALCGAELPRGELPDLVCEPGCECERMTAYCPRCLDHAAKVNADAAGRPVDAGAGR